MSTFVLDCSVTMAWCFEDETSESARLILDRLNTTKAIVPGIWPLEVANVLAISERRGRLTAADMSKFIKLLGTLPITVDEETSQRALNDVLTLARTHQLTAYDAAYLELAIRHETELATFDEVLQQAATKLGIKTIDESC